ncbi:hypothetical protein ABZU09_06585 [Lactobacillus mulieris]|jgi:hypothetical protein|uniref:Uncharacterized protein n=2 Tax=root TaxID=1 RepID=A0AAP3M312_9LACO|nr:MULTISPECIES: hypothetical protein [Lactobacillus]EEU21591.1 hypothetical protein HMPREF0525_00525 [Lactobacillus jensenii 27-2-CHN]EEX24463.1 hypothetical protein HMPREF0974_00268 [Lactobacillus jensenii 115-3-CHN]EFH29638.1 hypothetical protein HMPREF0526_11241 [Lactobacillus jensenii JV-V16]KAA9244867.1 hypothetical protein F6I33_02280 [Lactobacillus jensenii]DAD80335.1 MAG TPA: hypothetical protein [Siphoviridae sp. ctX581]
MRKEEIEEYIQREIRKPPVDYQISDPFIESLNDEEMAYLEKRLIELSKTWQPPYEYLGP